MNNLWSNFVQGVNALEYDRRRRVRDEHKELYLKYLGLKKDSIIADIGSGPGYFSRKFARWLDFSPKIIGIERDTRFIRYAQQMNKDEGIENIQYLEGDALALPLEENSVDACYSCAVIQYVDPEKFLKEQKRICKPGGTVAVMNMISSAKYFSHDNILPQKTEREKELWEMILRDAEEQFQEMNLLKYEMEPKEYPILFEKLGFKDIEINALNLYYAVDDARNSLEKKLEIIEADRHNDLEQITEIAVNSMKKKISNEIIEELKDLIEKRYKERKEKAANNEHLWDFRISTLFFIKGTK